MAAGITAPAPAVENENELRALTRRFVREELADHEAEVDQLGEIPAVLAERVARRSIDIGLHAFNMPAEVGGPGLSYTLQTVVRRELARSSFALADLVVRPPRTLLHGTDGQRERFLLPAVRGEARFAFALTEPEAGSDPGSMTTRAEWTPAGYVLTGLKHFISHGGAADYVIVYARTRRDGTDEGISALVVRNGQAGFSCSRQERTMGWVGSPVSELVFQDCLVPFDDVLGQPGEGLRLALGQINEARLGVAAHCVGMAELALELATEHLRTRRQFGQPLAANQGLQWQLADMACQVEQARALLAGTAAAVDAASIEDRANTQYRIPMAKLVASETAGRVIDAALQMFGGMGYMRGVKIEQMYRDVRAFRIGEGTSEMQRTRIARTLLGRWETA